MGLSGLLGLEQLFPYPFREVFNYYLLKYFLTPLPFVFFCDAYHSDVRVFDIVPEVSEAI